MTGVSESIEPSAVAVPRQAERARRISRLLSSSPVLTVVYAWFGLDAANDVFGFWADSSGIPLSVALCGAVLATLLRSTPAASRLGRVQTRAPGRGVRWVLFTLSMLAVFALQPPVLGTGRMVLFLIPIFGWLAFEWWQERWWPRLVLSVMCGIVSALLPLWLPAPDKGMRAIQLIFFGCGALSTLVDQWELRRLLDEAEREAYGGPADAGAPR